MNKSEIKSIITLAYSRKTDQCIRLMGDDNPQVVEMYNKAMAEADVLSAIIALFEGNKVNINLI